MNNKPVFWKMGNGKSIDIDSMDLNHLRNVLKMIIRNREKAIQPKPKEFILKGDIAQSFNDDNYSDLEDVQWSDGEFYKEL